MAAESPACTSFYLPHPTCPVVGQNLDWPDGEGLVVINKRGVSKTAIVNPGREMNPARWTSRYGSVTFNQYGFDWPWGGMNEAGLVGGSLLLKGTEYPAADQRPSVFMGQWLQYQLDNCRTVQEVMDSDSILRIRTGSRDRDIGVHYFFADASGECMVIAFLNRQQHCFFGKTLPIAVLTNDPYPALVNAFEKNQLPQEGTGGNLAWLRFVRAAMLLQHLPTGPDMSSVIEAFSILDKIAYRNHSSIETQWRIVHDIQNRRIYFHTLQNRQQRIVDLKQIDFSCTSPVMMMPVNAPGRGNVTTAFKSYNYETNRAAFETAFIRNPLKVSVHEERMERLSRYPETFTCINH